jgi:hypothetical protein
MMFELGLLIEFRRRVYLGGSRLFEVVEKPMVVVGKIIVAAPFRRGGSGDGLKFLTLIFCVVENLSRSSSPVNRVQRNLRGWT